GLVLLAVNATTVTGLAQAYGWSSSLWADTRAPGGTLGNRNFLAHLAVIGVPLAGWLLIRARGWLGVTVAMLGLGLLPAVIVLSRSRAAWVGMAAVVVAAGVTRLIGGRAAPSMPVNRLRLGLIAAALGVVAALVVPNRLDWRSGSPYRDTLRTVLNYREGSGRGRLIQYENSLRMLRSDPLLGVGPGNWMVAYPRVTTAGDPSFAANDPIPTNPWPSSDWIALLTERGLLGALAWLAFLGSAVIVLLRRAREADQTLASVAAMGVMAAAASQGLFDAVLLLAVPTLVTMIALGALTPQTRDLKVVSLAGRRGRLLGGFLLGMGLLTAKSVGQIVAIERAGTGYPVTAMREALRYDPGNYRLHLFVSGRTRCDIALPHARRAAALLPNHTRPKQLLNRCT
ncbi:MAG: O-antigen ligase family protein, partial [Gemmatimonadales bacterium]